MARDTALRPGSERSTDAPSTRPTPCPRCRAPVTGDFKFCPTCAYRLKTEVAPAEESAGPRVRWPGVLVGALLVVLVFAVFAVGLRIFAPSPSPPAPDGTTDRPGTLGIRGLLDLVVNLPPGTGDSWPDPANPGWELPVRVPWWSKVLKYEVTRGMYATFVRDCDASPEKLPAFLRDIWRPLPRGDAAADAERLAASEHYVDRWWARFEEHERARRGGPVDRPPTFKAPLSETYGNLLLVPPSWVRMTGFEEFLWQLPPGTEALPVTEVSWWDAVAFAEWVSAELDVELRLPTDVEWMLAGSGGEPGRRYPWGGEALRYACNCRNFWGEHNVPHLHRVDYTYNDAEGRTKDGIWGLSGNAREWTHNHELVPVDGRYDIRLTPAMEYQLGTAPTMGGSYLEGIDDCTVDRESRDYRDKLDRWPEVGFRLWMEGDPW